MNAAKRGNREIWIDWSKAICIFLMIVGHMFYPLQGTIDWEIKNLIYSFHMPVFFYLSGFLFKSGSEKFGSFFIKSVRSLIIPYIFFNIISFVGLLHFFDSKELSQGLYETLIGGGHSFAGATWFLLCLFWLRLISYFITKHIYLIFLSLPVSILVAYFCPHNLWWGVGTAFMAFPFFIIGFLHKDYRTIYPLLDRICDSRLFAFSSFITLVFINHVNHRVDMFMLDFGEIPALYYIESFIGVFFIISFSKSIGTSLNIITKISKGTIVIMGTHIVISYYVKYLLIIIGQQNLLSNSIQSALFVSVFVFLVSIFVVFIMQRYFSFFIGGRK